MKFFGVTSCVSRERSINHLPLLTYLADVIMWHTVVNILSIGLIDENAFRWIPARRRRTSNEIYPNGYSLFIPCEIIVHHHDDMRVGNAILMQDLIGMADIGLMTVVVPTVRAGNQYCPIGGGRSLD